MIPRDFICTLLDIANACDCILWAGDFNFRVDMPYQEVIENCENETYSKILENDEFHTLKMKFGKMICFDVYLRKYNQV